MAGHITKRGDKLVLRVYVGRDPLDQSKRLWRTKTIDKVPRREAERELARFVAEVVHTPARGSTTFAEFLDRWYDMAVDDWSPSTAINHRNIIDTRLKPSALAGVDLRDLTPEKLEQFYRRLRRHGSKTGGPLAVSTVRRYHSVVHLALASAKRLGYIPTNPAESARPGKGGPAEIKPPTAKQVRTILEAAAEDPEVLLFLSLDAETGARRGELAALRFTDLPDGNSLEIKRTLVIGFDTPENRAEYEGHIWPARWRRAGEQEDKQPTALIEKPRPKTSRGARTVTLSPAAVALAHAQRVRLDELALAGGFRYPEDGFIFPATPEGDRPLRPDVWTRRFGKLRDKLDLKSVRLHDLRHFVATSLLAAGVDLSTVGGRLGHAGGGKTTLAVYGHFLKEPDAIATDVMAELLGRRADNGPDDGGAVVPLTKNSKASGTPRAPRRRAERRAAKG